MQDYHTPTAPTVEILYRYACRTFLGEPVEVIEKRYFQEKWTDRGYRWYPGSRFWALQNGTIIKLIDVTMFEVVETGGMLFRD